MMKLIGETNTQNKNNDERANDVVCHQRFRLREKEMYFDFAGEKGMLL